MAEVHDILEDYYGPLLKEHGFSLEPENHEYGRMGLCWQVMPAYVPKFMRRMSLPAIFASRAPRSMVCRDWSTCLALNRQA